MAELVGTIEKGELWFCNSCGRGFALSPSVRTCPSCDGLLSQVLQDGQAVRRRLRGEIQQMRNDLLQRDNQRRELENALRKARQDLGGIPDYMHPLEGQLALNISDDNGEQSGG